MTKERHKQINCKAESTNVLCRDGQDCSSSEVSVMGMEQRNLATSVTRKNSQLNNII